VTMMWQWVAALITGVVGLVAYWFKSARELRLKYDAELRGARLKRYQGLWSALAPLAKYSLTGYALSHSEALDLQRDLTSWYFQDGGLYLSTDSRGAFFALLDVLDAVTRHRWGIEGPGARLDAPTAELARVSASRLRTSLTRDVGTRRPFMLAHTDHHRFRVVSDEARLTASEGTYSADGGGASETHRLILGFESRRRPRWSLRRRHYPTVVLDDESRTVTAWEPSLQRVTFDCDGTERALIIEGDRLVESPRDWESVPAPARALLWRRRPRLD
jgi:hypothetical protein